MIQAHDVTWYSRKPHYKEQVEEHLANLLSIGLTKERLSEKGYEFALALQTDDQIKGETYISATMMARAAELVREALTGAYRIYELRTRMR